MVVISMNINLSPPCQVEITPELLLKAKLSFVFREITDKITNLVYFEDNKDVIKNALESLLLKIDIQYDENSNWCDPDAIIEKFNYWILSSVPIFNRNGDGRPQNAHKYPNARL